MYAEKNAVGIDLGTTYSCVGFWKNNRIEIIPNEQGNRTTPSYVSFTDTEILVGEVAKHQVATNPYNTVFDVHRLIGRNFYDPDFQTDMKHWPFRIFEKNGRLYVRVRYKGEKKDFSPEEITSMILLKMKDIAEAFLGESVKNVVITVPNYFNSLQRQAIVDASTIAGLNALRIINSPSAAAIAYELDRKPTGLRNVLVFDLGGGTCNVSLFDIKHEGILDVIAVAGNNHLGGEDFDNRIVNHFVQEFKNKFNKDLTSNVRALCRLREQCERAKRILSASKQAFIEIDSLFEDIDFHTSLTRDRFEKMNQDLFMSITELIDKVLQDSRMKKSDVNEIVLVGGSTRIPKIQRMISEFFNGKELNKSINSDEAAAYGASTLASILSGNTSKKLEGLLLVEANSLSLGIETLDGNMLPFIMRNESIPNMRSKIISTDYDNQSFMFIQVYEGNSTRSIENNLLGEFELSGILPAPKGVPQIKITFDINADGILNVSAFDKTTGRKNKITITSGFSKEEIERLVAETEKYRMDKERVIQKVQARNVLESYTYDLRNVIQCIENMKNELENAVQDSITWLDENQESEKDEYEFKLNLLKKIANPIVMKLGVNGSP
ncbi:heat shock protein HSS1 [Rhizophagus clarus]|uniref:Heat shock protein HSS1 n=1 Tax=Rhizophagus clarus TaxID=94130 RepID=A0A8H3QG35_9GLOM|nr:heat shock protein HSS1 [Rhizophagus clarus]